MLRDLPSLNTGCTETGLSTRCTASPEAAIRVLISFVLTASRSTTLPRSLSLASTVTASTAISGSASTWASPRTVTAVSFGM